MIYIINTGTSSNQGDGDTLRSAFNKINQNFQYLSTASMLDASNITSNVVPATSNNLTLGTATSVWKTLYLGSDGLQIGGNVLTVNQGDLTLNGSPISSSGYTLPVASDTVLGGVKIGSGITIDGYGVISTSQTPYTLPVASDTVLGGVKIGNGIQIDAQGVISPFIGEGSFNVSAPTSAAYIIDGMPDPSLVLMRGFKYTFNISTAGHPFWITSVAGAYNPSNVYSSGVTNNGTVSGTLTFVVPPNAPDTLFYVCQYHPTMTGAISIRNSSAGSNTGDFLFTNTTMLVTNAGSLSIVSDSAINLGTSSTFFTVNGTSRLLQVPNGGGIVAPSSGDTFFIRNVSQIQFADNTVQTTAAAGGTGAVSSLTNNGNVVSLSSTGTTTFPGPVLLGGKSFSAFTEFVSSSTVTISAGFGATPQAGWKYNGVTIQSVDVLSGAFRLYLQFPVFLNAGYYPLTPIPGIGGTVIFSDGTEQSTAWNGSFTPTNVLDWASPAPTTIADAINRLAAVVKVLNNNVGA